jgi:acyl-CoA oxidase
MAESTGWDLLKAVAVAYHYTSYRKQFRKSNNQTEETTVIDYASVQHRLIPLLAQATALVLVGQNIKKGYDNYSTSYIKTGDFSQLEDYHLQTVGAKVYSTEITGHGVEACRIACGGHGYHALSGFGRMYANAINAVTYEGDNYVVGQQVPRAILKHWRNKSESSLPTLSYLSKLRDRSGLSGPKIESEQDWARPDVQRWALEERLVNLVQQHIEDTEAGGDTSYSCHALTMAHGDFVYWKGFHELLSELEKSRPPFLEPIKALFQVFGLSVLQNPHHPSLAHALPLSQSQHKSLRLAKAAAIEDLKTNHLAHIIEAYGFTEYEMDSALARSDTEPYEALFQEGAVRSEMSGTAMSYLWPMMVDTRRMWKKIEEEKAGKAKL